MKRDLSTLQANADLHAVLELLKRWRDKSDNEDLKEFEKMNNQSTGQAAEKVDLEDDLYVDFEEMDEEEEDKP